MLNEIGRIRFLRLQPPNEDVPCSSSLTSSTLLLSGKSSVGAFYSMNRNGRTFDAVERAFMVVE